MSFPDPSPRHAALLSASSIRNGVVTHPYLHVRDAHDAHVVLEAVRLNILPIIKRRLLSSEREELKSGHVYVWEEAQDEGGLLRWTDGRRWSQSRMRGDYLFYEEKVETTQEERDAKAARRARRASDPNAVLPLPTRRKDRPSKPDGLTKQTYSVAVHLPGSSETRKWHVVAYFSGSHYSRLPVIENYDYLRNIRVPHGIFTNSKVHSSRIDRFSHFSDESDVHDDQSHAGKLPLYDYSLNVASPTSSPTSPYMLASPPRPHHVLPSPLPGSSPRDGNKLVVLPPLTSLAAGGRRPSLPHPHVGVTGPGRAAGYTPLSSEDRRVLDSFRVVL
ncbi:putative gti1/Pac2 family protein [Lyophyllum shimeji]|uniref:Gti1/Pac2 family protein n=1 Tax=Lyophyllum shimeji TaxID=47721 RepID=A0A9P3UV22_LYOSH|nr:putative gti1/Pac2 family protein [Lyophyllum shimeji]